MARRFDNKQIQCLLLIKNYNNNNNNCSYSNQFFLLCKKSQWQEKVVTTTISRRSIGYNNNNASRHQQSQHQQEVLYTARSMIDGSNSPSFNKRRQNQQRQQHHQQQQQQRIIFQNEYVHQSYRFPLFRMIRLYSTPAGTNATSISSNTSADPIIQARPPNEKNETDNNNNNKFELPDKKKEQYISQIQIEVQELHRSGQYTKALEVAEKLLIETKDHFGHNTNHPAIAAAYNNVGLMYKLLGQYNDSRKQYQLALQMYSNTVGNDHASYASILHNLGNLNRMQIHIDDTLRITDRLSLIESAITYLEDAYHIRKNELGIDHPHTIASRSSWGATLATQILHHYKATTASSTTSTGTQNNNNNNDLVKRRFYLSLLPDSISSTAWKVAEDHLREALQIAIEKPRGTSIIKQTKSNMKRSGGKQTKKPIITKKQDMESQQQKEKHDIVTLSAASAAQNLAIFLKCRATTLTSNDDNITSTAIDINEDNQDNSNNNINQRDDWLMESHLLYTKILHVQSILLPEQHPDRYTTKHSFAELLDVMGDEESANMIRQEVIDTYDPPSSSDLDDDFNNNNKDIVT